MRGEGGSGREGRGTGKNRGGEKRGGGGGGGGGGNNREGKKRGGGGEGGGKGRRGGGAEEDQIPLFSSRKVFVKKLYRQYHSLLEAAPTSGKVSKFVT